MYFITKKSNAVILGICRLLRYLENGYPLMIEENTAFNADEVNVYEVEVFPEDVAVYKYCYDPEGGFYKNPLYREPENPLEERVKELEAALAALTAGAQAAVGGANE